MVFVHFLCQSCVTVYQSQRALVVVRLAVIAGPTYKWHRKCIKIVYFLCQSRVLIRFTCGNGHCVLVDSITVPVVTSRSYEYTGLT